MGVLDDYIAQIIEDKSKEFDRNFNDFNIDWPVEIKQIKIDGVIHNYLGRYNNISPIGNKPGDLAVRRKYNHFNAIVSDGMILVILDNYYSRDRLWDCLIYDLYTSKSVDMNEVDVLAETREIITLPNELIIRS